MKYLIIVTAGLLLSACVQIGQGPASDIHDYCALTNFIYVASGDEFSEETAAQILLHNELKVKLCQV